MLTRSVHYFDFDMFMTRSVNCFDFDMFMTRLLAITRRILDENPQYSACVGFSTRSIDLEWSLALGSFKMKV